MLKKYDIAKVFLSVGVIIKSLILPFTLSWTINILEQKATVIHETDNSEPTNWPLTKPLSNLLLNSIPLGIELIKASLYTLAKKCRV